MAKRHLAAQLYTVRDQANKGFAGTIKQVADILGLAPLVRSV